MLYSLEIWSIQALIYQIQKYGWIYGNADKNVWTHDETLKNLSNNKSSMQYLD